jgi:hypothetical protein
MVFAKYTFLVRKQRTMHLLRLGKAFLESHDPSHPMPCAQSVRMITAERSLVVWKKFSENFLGLRESALKRKSPADPMTNRTNRYIVVTQDSPTIFECFTEHPLRFVDLPFEPQHPSQAIPSPKRVWVSCTYRTLLSDKYLT